MCATKSDADFHNPILAAGDHEAAKDVTRRRLRARGWTELEIVEFLAKD
jgi:hypothetical protein